ncbi:MAG: AbrB family transcriptional regulator, partial [Pseudomonadota bacterium]
MMTNVITRSLQRGWREKWQQRLTHDALRKLALGLAIGILGGIAASFYHVPLAWMLGPLFFCMIASAGGLPALVPMWLRGNFMLIIGLFLGESFDGLDLAMLAKWPVSMAGAVLYMPVATFLAYLFYRYLVRQDPMTSICSSIPGGLTALVVISGSLGADERNVALAQSLRIAFVVCSAPLLAFGLMGHPPPDDTLFDDQKLISVSDLTLLLGLSLALIFLLRKTPVPILPMVCPLAVSAVLRPLGVIEGVLPHWMVEVGLLVLGASVGTRFA